MTKEKYKEGKRYSITYLQDGKEKKAEAICMTGILHVHMGPGSYFIPDVITKAKEINAKKSA